MRPPVLQIIFNEISAAEISSLDTELQLELLTEFTVTPDDLENLDGDRFGKLERDGKTFYRYRAKEYRIYFEVGGDDVIVHRVLHKNTFTDFLFRSNLSSNEDEQLSQSKNFWKLIEEGENARQVRRWPKMNPLWIPFDPGEEPFIIGIPSHLALQGAQP